MIMTNCKDCTTNCVYRGKDNEARCGGFVGTITKADRIRAMSDEELAEFISDCGCPNHSMDCMKSCKDCTLKWLKQPVEDDNG
jgi:hypothetical protein